MFRMIKFEMFKIVRDPVLKICIMIALLVSFVMLSGTNITIGSFVQKSFLVSIIASLYAAFYASIDFEDRKILYLVLSGNDRAQIVIAKLTAVFIGTEIINFIFPITVFFLCPELENALKIKIFFSYILLGGVLAAIGELFSWILKRQGIAILVTVIFHIGSLLMMNGEKTSNIFLHIVPIGIVKLCLETNSQIMHYMLLGIWFVILFILTIIISRRSEV